ncbi:hypothetical protein [Fulvivirga sp.]|uniref:hypothetical protein n=1 Tax=Fulvivirga sp. TaxID=1931237 RepID=UPI0032ED43C8
MKCKVGLLYYDLRCVGIIDKLLLFWFKKFIRKSLLAQYVNKSINTVALATAAFSFYANPLGESLGLIPIFATEKGDLANDVECLSEVKASRVRNYFRDEVDLFFTDHYDDLPTIRIAKKTVLVNPSSLSKDRILASLEEERIEFYNY